MAISKADIAAIPDYTDGEMVKLCKLALSQILAGSQSYSINGRTFSRANLNDLKKLLAFYEDRVEEATNGSQGNIALVEFRGP